jgi:formate hydrogenlyase transcriptional activator
MTMKSKADRPEQAALSTSSGQTLRQQAEKIARGKAAQSSGVLEALSPEKTRQTLHELRVHQIELEMQNEELRRVQVELEAARSRYFDLYDLAPVGYVTLSEQGLIWEANLTAAQMLGLDRRALVKQPIARFILKEDQDIYYRQHKLLLETGALQECELRMAKKDGTEFWAHLEASAAQEAADTPEYRMVMSDITERIRLAGALQEAHNELEKRVEERTSELQTANEQLGKEIKEHRQDEESLRQALSEIKSLKDRLEAENIYFRQEAKKKHQFDPILGQSDGLKYVLYRAEQVAPQNTTVLILGETGTGKELIAAVIHNLSPRRDRPLITVNCAALPGNLIESELFGREKGAFTGADTRQIGRFEIAHGSTLCLDEIGELPLELQAKLLRVIQHNEFERLGSSRTIKVDVRIVATTNRNLEEEVRKGRFRQDLYYRINVFPITVPPLRQRQEDIPILVQAFTERYARKLGKQITSIQKETMKALQDYHWPGNIRELESIIERAVILCPGPVLQLTDKLEIASLPFSAGMNTLEEAERNQILNTLAETRWRLEGKNGAAAILGLHPSTLRARMHKLGIARPKIKDSD